MKIEANRDKRIVFCLSVCNMLHTYINYRGQESQVKNVWQLDYDMYNNVIHVGYHYTPLQYIFFVTLVFVCVCVCVCVCVSQYHLFEDEFKSNFTYKL